MTKASLIVSLSTRPSADGHELLALPDCVDWLEVRADLVGGISTDWLRSHFKGRLQFNLRSSGAGGACEYDSVERKRRLMAAAASYDRIELEADRDISPELLAA